MCYFYFFLFHSLFDANMNIEDAVYIYNSVKIKIISVEE